MSSDMSWNSLQECTFEQKALNIVMLIGFVVSQNHFVFHHRKTDLTKQTESEQFLRSVSIISYLLLRRKFGFSGTGGKLDRGLEMEGFLNVFQK